MASPAPTEASYSLRVIPNPNLYYFTQNNKKTCAETIFFSQTIVQLKNGINVKGIAYLGQYESGEDATVFEIRDSLAPSNPEW